MKISIACSILILLGAALFGMRNHQRLVSVRESHAKLVAAAAQIGVSIVPSHPDDPIRITKRGRENKNVAAKAAAAEFIAFAKEMEAIEKNGGPPDAGQQKRIMEIMDRMMSLDSAQLKVLIAEVSTTKDLKDETRQGLIGFSIMTLSNDHPQAALALLTDFSDLFKDNGMGTHVVSTSLAKWAKDDPLAALEWVRKNSGKFPDLITDDAKRGLISGTATEDPKLAFKLIGELGLKDVSQSISRIVEAAGTPEQRSATLAILREHLSTLTSDQAKRDTSNSALTAFGKHVAGEGFDSASKWVASADFTPAELESFARGLKGSIKNGENGQWIEWIGEKLPPNQANDKIESIVNDWTRNDYQAAGKWLTTAPDGPGKNTAIRSYAATISEYEPETAAQWAMTLPPGKDRDTTLKQIHQNWPDNDSTAKEAFKQQHGIK